MIAIYARQSLFKKDSLSIEQQTSGGISMCEQNGWEYQVYSDAGYSGKDMNRPGFIRMLQDVKAGQIDKIICYKFDRISRNIADFCSLLEELQKYHCEFLSISENFDTTSPIGRAMVYICMVFAQMERENISQRVHDNYYYRTELGFWGGGYAPYGYKLARIKYKGKMHTVLEPEPETLRVVQDIYTWYLEPNGTATTILRKLNNELHIPSRKGTQWTSRVLMDILSRPLYAPNDMTMYNYLTGIGAKISNPVEDFDGKASVDLYGKKGDGSKHKRCREVSDMYCNVSSHDAIIDSDTWIRVQQKRKSLLRTPNRAGTGKNSPFTGLMTCECCGTGVSYTNSRGTQGYYICSSKKNRGWDSCEQAPFPVKTSNPAIMESVISHYADPDVRQKLNDVKLDKKKESPADLKQRNSLMGELSTVQAQIDNLLESIASGNPTLIKYANDKIVELDSKKNEISDKIDLLNDRKSDYTKDREKVILISQIIDDIPGILQNGSFDERRDLCHLLVKKIVFKKDHTIDVKCTI
ncbi:Site-specific DNA recombinase [Hespellia stercorisuis DSM 15480]|uniref:Site-specific DNA recombinase n=1 Tax=Hespellia stercorisuis DSM 15480 TaxID=1121950 RepID=A0A1M6VG66_9FIRM|nr:Site-specific DNA recombinase [Hespellia stercorisuis DSM 15480]